tara:strand:- start:1016 stop:1192 length:177 start_codon:yes stop_codon:yes gene_type:complete
MKYIKLILGTQACILGLLVIVWMLMELAFIGMELDMMAYDYEIMEQINAEQRSEEKLD